MVPRLGFQGADNSVVLDLKIALETATESLALISRISKRYFFPIPTHLMSLLITEIERQRDAVSLNPSRGRSMLLHIDICIMEPSLNICSNI